jgi:UbiD family decarboxylase
MEFRRFLEQLEQRGALARVRRPVSAELELAAVVKKLKGRPVLFEAVAGHRLPVAANLCASRSLLAEALGVAPRDLALRLADAVERPVEPEVVPAPAYQEVEDLRGLPVLRYHPRDGGPYIASGVVVACDPEHGPNVSYHRAMVLGPDRLVLRVVERHLHAYIRRGLTRFAFCLGNPTTVMVAAAISAELGKSELAMANALRPTPVSNVEGHLVPASEVILLCELTGEVADEGPFLDLTETFDVVRRQPVVRVTRVLARPGAVFHALLPGDLEHKTLMGLPREPTIFREVSRVCECLEVFLAPGGCSWLHAVVRIRKRHGEDGRRAVEAAFRGHASLKHVFVVDEDIDVEDPRDVEWAMATRFQGDRGIVVRPGEKGSSLDPSSEPGTGATCKVGFDLTAAPRSHGKDFRRPEPVMDINLDEYLG